MDEVCNDNRFEIIKAAKQRLIEATNIESRPEEMAVLDSILFRLWQMGWLPGCEHSERTCEGCIIPSSDYGHAPSPCNFCVRNHEDRYDLYTPSEVK